MLVIGMCLGWGIGAAAMKAALSARNQDVLRETLLRAQERYVYPSVICTLLMTFFASAAGAVNPDAQFELSVFQGMFLDARWVFPICPPGHVLHPSQVVRRVRMLPRLRGVHLRAHPGVRTEACPDERVRDDRRRHRLRTFCFLARSSI